MSYASETLLKHLTDVESLDHLAEEGFDEGSAALEVVPGEAGQTLVGWAVRYYYDSGRRQAPTKDALLERWGDLIEAEEIDLGDGTQDDTIAYLVATLRQQHVRSQGSHLVKASAMGLHNSDDDDLVTTISEIGRSWDKLKRVTESRRKASEAAEGVETAYSEYMGRLTSGVSVDGLRFGLSAIDEHLHGVHPGELCTWAAETGVGKSWMAARTIYEEFKAGNRCMLFTLENNLPMTFDRVICMNAHIDYERWQQACITEAEEKRFYKLRDRILDSDNGFRIEMPNRGERSVGQMVRKALAMNADSIIIDQLTFIEPVGNHTKKSDEIYEVMHDLKELVSEGAEKLPVMLLHQINRDGAAYKRKAGIYLPEHMSYGSEVERTTDFLFAIYQSEMDERVEEAQFQLIKSRRTREARWQVNFAVGAGDIRVRYEVDEETEQEELVPA